jgi:hypothetical protein
MGGDKHWAAPQPAKSYEWQERKTHISTLYEFVDLKSSRILVRVAHYNDEPNYFIFQNGAGMGEYQSLELAKKKAEKLVL